MDASSRTNNNGAVLFLAEFDKFFAFNDQNNCQRVYEKIIEMDRREKSNDTEAQKVPVSL